MLVIKQLKKSYKVSSTRNSLILNNINFTFNSKGLYFVLGKSGSGKSTLINILSGLIKADSGEVLFNDKDILKFNKKQIRNYLEKDVSILFQKYNLFEDMTVLQNIQIAKSIKGINDNKFVEDLLIRYKLDNKKNQLVKKLSGGEKQRLSLIRALINKPKILFCDEPTGALDEENSLKLMDDLKALSEEFLVIVVTHNLKLFELYKCEYLILENGEIKEKCFKNINEKDCTIKSHENKLNRKYIYKIAEKNVRNNWKKDIINLISACFSMVVLVISIFFNSSIIECKDVLLESYGDANTYEISLTKTEEIKDSPIDLVRSERPSYSSIYPIFSDYNCMIGYSYDYFFKSTKRIKFNNKSFEDFEIKPYIDLNLPINSLIINDKMADLLGEGILGQDLSINIKCDYNYISERTNITIIETFEAEIPFNVKEIVKEFNYMNSPCIYYSQLYFEEILKNTIALNSSIDRNKNVSFYDLVSEAKDDSEISNYSYNIFSFGKETNLKLRKFINSDELSLINLELTSRGYTLVTSFITISESLFLGMNFFIILLVLTSLFISGFLAYSSIVSNRKEIAILRCLGGHENNILEIYLIEHLVYSISGIVMGLGISYLLKDFLNMFLKNYFITSNLIIFNEAAIIFIIVLSIIFVALANYIPLKFTKINGIAEELKEE